MLAGAQQLEKPVHGVSLGFLREAKGERIEQLAGAQFLLDALIARE